MFLCLCNIRFFGIDLTISRIQMLLLFALKRISHKVDYHSEFLGVILLKASAERQHDKDLSEWVAGTLRSLSLIE